MTRASVVSKDWVDRQRSMNRGWQTIAAMAGVAEVDLRLLHGGLDKADHPGLRAVPETEFGRVVRAMRDKGLSADQASVIGRLYEARGHPQTRPSLTKDVALPNYSGGQLDYHRRQFLLNLKKAARPVGLCVEIGRHGTALSKVSLARLRRMIGGGA